MKSIITVLTIAFLSVGCMEFNQNEVVYDHELIGVWSNIQWSEGGITMEKVNKLKPNTYGYLFNSNGTMVARTNAGWCGTPPIVTSDHEGTWKIEEGKIVLSFGYWGGDTTQEWQIAESNKKRVTIQIINQEYNAHP